MDPTFSNKQISGSIDRAIAVLLTYLIGVAVHKGYLGESDAATLLPALVLIPSIIWGLWANRQKALVQAAAQIAGTTVVTSPSLATATPESNIVANNNNKVVSR